jgi:hypothetical protein
VVDEGGGHPGVLSVVGVWEGKRRQGGFHSRGRAGAATPVDRRWPAEGYRKIEDSRVYKQFFRVAGATEILFWSVLDFGRQDGIITLGQSVFALVNTGQSV